MVVYTLPVAGELYGLVISKEKLLRNLLREIDSMVSVKMRCLKFIYGKDKIREKEF